MKRFSIHLLPCCVLLSSAFSCRQITLVVSGIPANTPPGAAIFVSGSFNHWDPGDRNYTLRLNPTDSTYSVALPKGSGAVEYRFTRGDWTTTEADRCGNPAGMRRLHYRDGDTVYADIAGWQDLGPTRCNEVTLILDTVPANTPPGAQIYMAGSFNGWNAADLKYRLRKNSRGKYHVRLPANLTEIEFKFTRGGWEKEEVNEVGNVIPNRAFAYGKSDTLRLSIPNWKDLMPFARGSRLTIVLTTPGNTPADDPVFIAGNFNKWNPRAPEYALQPAGRNTYTINLPRRRNHIEFKFTRGDWAAAETDASRNPGKTRSFSYGHLDTLRLEVKNWADLD